MAPGDIFVVVEHCTGCARHRMSLHHNAEQYRLEIEYPRPPCIYIMPSTADGTAHSHLCVPVKNHSPTATHTLTLWLTDTA